MEAEDISGTDHPVEADSVVGDVVEEVDAGVFSCRELRSLPKSATWLMVKRVDISLKLCQGFGKLLPGDGLNTDVELYSLVHVKPAGRPFARGTA